MAGLSSRKVIAIIPLGHESVLLPGISLRIPVQNRPDIPALLSALYSRSATSRPGPSISLVGCVPLWSPLLSPEGQNLLEGSDTRVQKSAEHLVSDPVNAQRKDLFGYGTVATISGMRGRRQGELALVVEGIQRFKVERFTQFTPYIECEGTFLEEDVIHPSDSASQALFQQMKQLSRELLTLARISYLLPQSTTTISPMLARGLELFIAKKGFQEAGALADFMTNVVDSTFEERLRVLVASDIAVRMERVIEILSRQVKSAKGNMSLTSITTTNMPPQGINITNIPELQQGGLYRRVMGGLPRASRPGSLGNGSSDNGGEQEPDELDELKQKLDDAKLTVEAQKVADKELKRLRKMNPAQAEYGVCRTYLETLAEIPWAVITEDKLGPETLQRARQQLDDDHYGLEKIKKRLLEYLAVLKLKQGINAELETNQEEKERANPRETETESGRGISIRQNDDISKIRVLTSKHMVDKSPILLLVGPPGTGKTSLAKSVATALGRKFHRISLGGVRDEAEIRGHRRTYVAAMPGLIVNGLKKVGVANPVLLLDEIDKVGGSSFHGDPSAAMLEVLDPEQNYSFIDHYVGIPIDLSKVLFIATANSLDTIPAPLLDRMEKITLSGYTTVEKRHIAIRHLIPKQLTTNGMAQGRVEFTNEVVDTIITSYTRESGVRNLEREIGSVCRYKAVEYAEAKDSNVKKYKPQVSIADIEDILGTERFDEEIAEKQSMPGIVTGLVAYSYGGQGSILFIEVADMPGNGRVQLTGKLGDVLKESVEVALTWVKAHSFELGLTHDANEDIMKNRSVHVHCPSGAIPKDGPSAGLAHTIALVSLFSGRAVPAEIAMTGEISLRGRVMPVGGIKEKLIGALRAGVKTVLIPVGNRKDVKDLPEEVKQGLRIVHVAYIWEAMQTIWPEARWPGEHALAPVESRL